eukprot:286920_1
MHHIAFMSWCFHGILCSDVYLDDAIQIDLSLVFIILSCLVIHLIFPLMASVRLIEVIVFERRVKEHREMARAERNRHRARRQRADDTQDETETVPINNDNQVRERNVAHPSVTSLVIHISRHEEKEQESTDVDHIMLDRRADTNHTFMYGDVTPNSINDERQMTSLSNVFAATTKFISSGVFNKWDVEDVCACFLLHVFEV